MPPFPRPAWRCAGLRWPGGVLLLLVQLGTGLRAEVGFSREIAPLLQAHCLGCHQAGKARGRYRLDTWRALSEPGATGRRPVTPGQPGQSELLARLEAADPEERMPRDAEPLPAEARRRIRRWIEEGAPFDGPDPDLALAALARPVPPRAPDAYPRPLPVTAVAFSPDGAEVAAAGYHELLVGSVAERRRVRRLGGLAERTSAVAWHPTRPWLVVAGGAPGRGGEVVVIDSTTGKLVRVLAGAADIPPALALAPDGRRVAVGGTDGTVQVLDVETGRRDLFLPPHADWVLALDWSPDGHRLVSASRDRTARVVEVARGEALASFTGHGAAVTAARFLPDGKSVWTAGRDRHLRRWEAANSESKQDLGGLEDEVMALAGLGDELWEALASGRVQRRPAGRPAQPVGYAAGAPVLSLAVHAATRQVAAGTQAGEVVVWDGRPGETPAPVRLALGPGRERPIRPAAGP